ncbi:MAG: C-GCAxxG-C-C family (seleno)protein [Candidatus Hermodarchaeota archaeon]
MKNERFNEILTQAYKRMHRYTCAEASLQALQTFWDLPLEGYSWATAGYLGAITSGKTTCGLLIGSSVAIGLRCGQGKEGIPEEHENEREKAIMAVNEVYHDFLKKFENTDCKSLVHYDLSKGEEVANYIANKGWKGTCDGFLQFIIEKCLQLEEDGKI